MTAPTLTLSPVKKSPLSKKDRTLLDELEAKVESSWLECCRSLAQIRDHEGGRLWNQEYKTFNEYVYSRFQYSSQHALRQVAAGDFILALENAKSKAPLPLRESQVRPIVQKLPEERRVKCWELIHEKHPGGDLQANVIEAEVLRYKKTIPNAELIGARRAKKRVKRDAIAVARSRSIQLAARLDEISKPLPRYKEITRLIIQVIQLAKLKS